MRLLYHTLSDETLALIERAVDAIGGRLAIYTPHNWAIENVDRPGALAFDPTNDSEYLRQELTRIIARGYV